MISNDGVKLIHGDCLDVLKGIPDNSVDSIVTDPPYGIRMMGKAWDYDVPEQAIWEECLRVLKPGGHLLAFAGTRTQHRMAVRIEDAGFDLRDMVTFLYDTNETAQALIESLSPEQLKLLDATFGRDSMLAWTYGSGFPKSMDVSKAIDRAAGAEREVVGSYEVTRDMSGGSWAELHGKPNSAKMHNITAPATEAARKWEGWGTALKPALEPITVARKPFKGTVAANVMEWGTGAINIDGCRVATSEILGRPQAEQLFFSGLKNNGYNDNSDKRGGRWPANLIHDGSDEPTELLGAAARFFYCAKASKKDRDEGLDCFDAKYAPRDNGFSNKISGSNLPRANIHPTVKPTDLMAYLCRLVTPPGGVVLDPFMGSGSTGKAAVREGFQFIGIEMDAEYLAIAEARIAHEAGKQTEK